MTHMHETSHHRHADPIDGGVGVGAGLIAVVVTIVVLAVLALALFWAQPWGSDGGNEASPNVPAIGDDSGGGTGPGEPAPAQ
jgi:hypothetical protein